MIFKLGLFFRSMFPTASPAPIPQTMTSQNFPLHALVLLLIALTERTNSWNARIHHPVKNQFDFDFKKFLIGDVF